MRSLFCLVFTVTTTGCLSGPLDHNLRVGSLEGKEELPMRLMLQESESKERTPSSNFRYGSEALSKTSATIKVSGLSELGKGLTSVGKDIKAEVSIREEESPANSPSSNLKAIGEALTRGIKTTHSIEEEESPSNSFSSNLKGLGEALSTTVSGLPEVIKDLPKGYSISLAESVVPERSTTDNILNSVSGLSGIVDKLVGDTKEPAKELVGLLKSGELLGQVFTKAGVYLLLILGVGMFFIKDIKAVNLSEVQSVIEQRRKWIYGVSISAGLLVSFYEGSNVIYSGHMDWYWYPLFGIQFPLATWLCAYAGLHFFTIRCELHGAEGEASKERSSMRGIRKQDDSFSE